MKVERMTSGLNRARCACAALLVAVLMHDARATPASTQYATRALFEAGLGRSLVDDYENPGYRPSALTILSDAAMTAVLHETRYTATSIPDLNVIFSAFGRPSNHFYCAGCNGTFTLAFTNTSLGDANGVFAVGFDLIQNQGTSFGALPFRAVVTFGDGDSEDILLPEALYDGGLTSTFFGLTSAAEIRSLAIVSAGFGATIAIDNLTIGASVPEPATDALLLLGAMGCAVRTGRRHRFGRQRVSRAATRSQKNGLHRCKP